MRVPWNRGGMRSYLLGLGLLAGYSTPAWIALGTPFLLAGIALHLWAKGCLHQNREVTSAGPYRFVRHPFYLANALLDLGIAIMSGWWPLQLALPVWWLTVYLPVMEREEAVMTALFGAAYAAYRSKVPLVFPYRRPLPRQPGGFSWANPNLLRTEVPRALRFLSYPLLFVISQHLYSHGLDIVFSPAAADVLTVAACIALVAGASTLRRHFKHQRRMLPAWTGKVPAHVVLLLAVIAVGALVTRFEFEVDSVIWPLGLALVGLSLVAQRTKPREPAIAQGSLALGVSTLCELPWFALLLVPLYLALGLDKRLAGAVPSGEPCSAEVYSPGMPIRLYSLLLGAGIALSVAKELWG